MTEQELNNEIGARISEIRRKRGMSQEELAGLIDSEKQNISRLERGRVNPGAYFLQKIAEAFDISLSELLNFKK